MSSRIVLSTNWRMVSGIVITTYLLLCTRMVRRLGINMANVIEREVLPLPQRKACSFMKMVSGIVLVVLRRVVR